MNMNEVDKYSVVIPVFNSEGLVGKTVHEIQLFFKQENLDFEVILVNDGSTDNSWNEIANIAKSFDNIKAINLLKNYGQHSAIICGMRHASGNAIIMMDDDLQNPPSEIKHLIDKMNEGYDAVFAKFKLKQHGVFRRLGSKLIGYLNQKVFNKPKGLTLSNFRIISRNVCDRMLAYHTYYPYIPGMILMFSSNHTNVEVQHHPRPEGQSNYSIIRILKLTARLLFSYSSWPLKFLTTFGLIVSSLSFIGGVYFLIKYITGDISVLGWTTVVVMVSFLCGFIILMLGVMGEYLIRIVNRLSVDKAYEIKEIVSKD